jgi:hypothetical protein
MAIAAVVTMLHRRRMTVRGRKIVGHFACSISLTRLAYETSVSRVFWLTNSTLVIFILSVSVTDK